MDMVKHDVKRRAVLAGIIGTIGAAAVLTEASPAIAAPAGGAMWFNAETDPIYPVTRQQPAATNRTNINQLIASVSQSGGGIIFFPGGDGDYAFAGGGISLKSNVSLVGAGPGVTRFSWAANSITTGGYFVYILSLQNVSISGIRFDAGTQPAANTLSVKIDGSSNVTVENCHFANTTRTIFIYNGSSDVRVHRNRFLESTRGQALYAAGDGTSVSHIRITDNHVENVLAPANDLGPRSAFYSAGSNIQYQGNSIADSYDTAIMFGNGSLDCSAIANTAVTTYVSLFVGSGAKRVRVIGNSLSSRSDYGIHAYNRDIASNRYPPEAFNVLSLNTITDCGKSGIHVEGAAFVNVTGNIIVNPATRAAENIQDREKSGILVTTASEGINDSSNCVVASNTIVDTNSQPRMKYGVFVSTAMSGVTVTGNTVRGASDQLVRLPSSLPPASSFPVGTQLWDGSTATAHPVWSDGSAWRRADGSAN